MRPLKLVIGFLLIPACVALTNGLMAFLSQWQMSADKNFIRLWSWFGGGFILWIVVFYSLPRPTRLYVLSHELTHALWGWAMGARVSKIKIAETSGSVTLSKSNFLISLAPYFFPFYTICALAVYVVISKFTDISVYEPFWFALFGLTWAFHVTFTLSTLKQQQKDVTAHGRLFSYTIIYVLNVVCVGLWMVGFTRETLSFFYTTNLNEVSYVYSRCMRSIVYFVVTLWKT